VITYLLDQGGIKVNSTNVRGLTPLDILLVSSWDSVIDGSLVNTLRKAGGQEGLEEGNPEPNAGKPKQIFLGRNRDNEKAKNDADILLVVATLVATMTFLIYNLMIICTIACVAVGLWASVRVVMFLWKNRPNWIRKIGWPKNEWSRKTTSIIFILLYRGCLACLVFILLLVVWNI
jgi:hypothetical protein